MSTGHMKRHAQDAGYSWRKWGDPLMYGKVGPDWNRGDLRRLAFVHLLIWAACIEAGVALGLVVALGTLP